MTLKAEWLLDEIRGAAAQVCEQGGHEFGSAFEPHETTKIHNLTVARTPVEGSSRMVYLFIELHK